MCVQADLVKLREQLRTLEGRQAHVGAVAASELESALAAVSSAGMGAALHANGSWRCAHVAPTHSFQLIAFSPQQHDLGEGAHCCAVRFACRHNMAIWHTCSDSRAAAQPFSLLSTPCTAAGV